MSESGKEEKAEYFKKYRQEHREQLNAYRREWAKRNPDKVKKYNSDYWNKRSKRKKGVLESVN